MRSTLRSSALGLERESLGAANHFDALDVLRDTDLKDSHCTRRCARCMAGGAGWAMPAHLRDAQNCCCWAHVRWLSFCMLSASASDACLIEDLA